MGFSSSVIFNGDPMSARIFIERDDEDWKKLGPRFVATHSAISGQRKAALERLLDHPNDQAGRAKTIPDVVVDES